MYEWSICSSQCSSSCRSVDKLRLNCHVSMASWKWGANAPHSKFYHFRKTFACGNTFFKNTKFVAESPPFWMYLKGIIELLNTQNLLCWKFTLSVLGRTLLTNDFTVILFHFTVRRTRVCLRHYIHVRRHHGKRIQRFSLALCFSCTHNIQNIVTKFLQDFRQQMR